MIQFYGKSERKETQIVDSLYLRYKADRTIKMHGLCITLSHFVYNMQYDVNIIITKNRFLAWTMN